MNKQGKTNVMVIVGVLVAVALLVYFFSGQVKIPGLPTTHGEMINGYWHEATQECRWDPDISIEEVFYPEDTVPSMFQCCFNQAGQQIDCNDASVLLGPFAIYRGTPNVMSIVHSITISNTGNVALTNAWLESATWTPSHTVLTTAYSGILGSTKGVAMGLGGSKIWNTGVIDLQAIGGPAGNPTTYNLALKSKATALGGLTHTVDKDTSMTVEKEGIVFTVDIALG